MIKKINWDEQPEDAAKEVQNLIDQLVDAVNAILAQQEEYRQAYAEDIVPMLTPEVQQKVATISNMKCPFCQQELDTGNYYVHCHNPGCNMTAEMEGTEEMWAALIQTRRALNVAVDALNTVTATPLNSRVIHDAANTALEQITALGQKE